MPSTAATSTATTVLRRRDPDFVPGVVGVAAVVWPGGVPYGNPAGGVAAPYPDTAEPCPPWVPYPGGADTGPPRVPYPDTGAACPPWVPYPGGAEAGPAAGAAARATVGPVAPARSAGASCPYGGACSLRVSPA